MEEKEERMGGRCPLSRRRFESVGVQREKRRGERVRGEKEVGVREILPSDAAGATAEKRSIDQKKEGMDGRGGGRKLKEGRERKGEGKQRREGR